MKEGLFRQAELLTLAIRSVKKLILLKLTLSWKEIWFMLQLNQSVLRLYMMKILELELRIVPSLRDKSKFIR